MKTTRIVWQELVCTCKNLCCNHFPTPTPLNNESNEIGEHCLHRVIDTEKEEACCFLAWETTHEIES